MKVISADSRADEHWNLPQYFNGELTWQAVEIALLTDIRRELQTLNAVFRCWRFQDIPNKLDKRVKNTKRSKRKK